MSESSEKEGGEQEVPITQKEQYVKKPNPSVDSTHLKRWEICSRNSFHMDGCVSLILGIPFGES